MSFPFEEEFSEMSSEIKRQILQERADSFLAQAFSWAVNAATLKRRQIPRAREAAMKREVEQSMLNAKQNLDALKITLQFIEELFPLDYEKASDPESLTLENMHDMISLDEQVMAEALRNDTKT